MSKSNKTRGEKVAGWAAIVPSGVPGTRIRIVWEVVVVVDGQTSIERRRRIDRDHDHLLREFMQASDG
jgi:hypothetical protein